MTAEKAFESAKRSREFNDAAAFIESRIRVETEDVVAPALAKRYLDEITADWRVVDGVCSHKLRHQSCLGDGRALFAHTCRETDVPGGEHATLWRARLAERDVLLPQMLTVHPYSLDLELLRKIVSFADRRDLEVQITPKSWHHPGRCLLVTLTPKRGRP